MEQIPILKIGPVLIVTIQTELHDRKAEELQEAILRRIQKTGASVVTVDITALEIVDSFIGRVLSETARMAKIMDTRVVLVGMRPAVTITLLEMGLELEGIDSAIDIEDGLKKLGFELRKIESPETRSERETMLAGEEAPDYGDD
ncbi:MAG: STAS domain-containing protein [Candidatus Eremiobacteraeota bacterium]|nr:STAS domain-containing protein [Candidatus Eremiobacteraeota bacterium]